MRCFASKKRNNCCALQVWMARRFLLLFLIGTAPPVTQLLPRLTGQTTSECGMGLDRTTDRLTDGACEPAPPHQPPDPHGRTTFLGMPGRREGKTKRRLRLNGSGGKVKKGRWLGFYTNHQPSFTPSPLRCSVGCLESLVGNEGEGNHEEGRDGGSGSGTASHLDGETECGDALSRSDLTIAGSSGAVRLVI